MCVSMSLEEKKCDTRNTEKMTRERERKKKESERGREKDKERKKKRERNRIVKKLTESGEFAVYHKTAKKNALVQNVHIANEKMHLEIIFIRT